LSVTDKFPLLGAVPVGVNVTVIVQLAFCAIPAPVVEQVPPETAKGPVVEIFENVTFVAVVLVFFTVTVIGALVVPCACAGKVSEGGVKVTEIACAVVVPLRVTVCGFPVALSSNTSVPELGAVPVGLNVTRIVHEVSGAIPVPPVAQVPPATANGPVVVALVKTAFAALVLLFSTVTVIGALVVPCACAGKVTLAGNVIVSGCTPVPDKLTVCTVFGPFALLVTVNSPCTAPAPVGANETLTLQL
jgi:hypothetical protein